MSSPVFHVMVISLAVHHVVGKCAEIGDSCDYKEWTATVRPIRDALNSGNTGSVAGLLTAFYDKLKSSEGYDATICHVYYDDNMKSVYNYGYDCGPDGKCHCGAQMVGSPTKTYQLVWDPVAKGCRRQTGQPCAKFGYIPEQQNCLTSDVCLDGTCTKSELAGGQGKKTPRYPKAGDTCDHSTWSSLYKPYLDAKKDVERLEGRDDDESQDAEEKSMDLFKKLRDSMDERPELYVDLCYSPDNVLICGEDNKCTCHEPYVQDPATKFCRTTTGDTCFTRCIHLPEDQCLTGDHCYATDVFKGIATCYEEGFIPERRRDGRKVGRGDTAETTKTSAATRHSISNLQMISLFKMCFKVWATSHIIQLL